MFPDAMRVPWISDDEIVLGLLNPPFPHPQFRLRVQDQSHHAVIFGRTGSGKSRLLQSVFVQHLNKRHGVGLLEPHHDLSFETLCYLIHAGFFRDAHSFDRLVYIDWGNGSYIPFNILKTRWDLYTTARLAADAVIRVWPELAQAPTFQTLFLAAVATLIANELPITYLYQLLVNRDWRQQCLAKVADPLVHQTFNNYFDKLGRDQTAEAGSLLRRAFLLSFSPVARYTLGQPDNWLDFRSMMDEGRSIIVNLGNINDPESRRLIGAMVMTQLEQAALSRTDLPPGKRTPFTLLVDEWPAFAAQEQTISHILSQSRKYNLRLYLAAQNLSQVGSDRLAGALENCRLSISFGLGRDSAYIQARQIGRVDPFAVKEQALTDTQHTQYLPIVEQFEQWTQQIQNLSPRMAYIKLHDAEPVLIRTLNVPDVRVAPAELERVLGTYRTRYQRTQAEAEEAISKLPALHADPQPDPSKPTGPAYTTLFQRKRPIDE